MSDERRRRVERGLKPGAETRASAVSVRLLLDRMELYGVAGVSVAVVDEGRVDWSAAYGLSSASEATPVSESTLFQCCSTSKMVASFVALRLVSLGQLDLDINVNSYLQDWKLLTPEGEDRGITLRQLLSHTGGVNVHGAPGYPRGSNAPTLDEVLRGEPPAITAPVHVTSNPGRSYRYSAGGYCTLQKVIQTVTGQPFETVARDLVLAPLGMHHSTFEQPLPESLWGQAASAHTTLAKAPVAEKWFVYPEMAVGGLWTTALDLAQVILEMQRAVRGEGQILTQDLAGEMLTLHADNHNIGLGTYVSNADDPSAAFFSHLGAHLGWQAVLTGYVHRGMGAVVLTNNGYTGGEFYRELLLSVADVYGWPKFTGSFR